jgi:Icc-related predicted phosphoesterase
LRIIVFGDIHMSTEEIRNIPDAHTADLIILNGDLTNFGTRKDAQKVLDAIQAVNPNVLAQIGNLDRYEINGYLDELDINLHGRARFFKEVLCLIGIGGSNITPFGTPSEFPEEQLAVIGNQAFSQGLEYQAQAESLHGARIPMLLLSHTPPYGTRIDRLRNGRHVGSTAVRELIEQYQPDLCVSGHIHEGKGTDTIGRTTIINPGMFRQGGWVDIHIHTSQIKAELR